MKPFNFLLSASVDSIEWPAKPSKANGFHLIAPYSRNPLEWLRNFWTDLHSNDRYRIRSKGHSNPASIRVRTFRDVLDRFREHPEAKSADRDGNPCGKKTVGLLRRLPVELLCVFHIGKEANLIEQQEEGVALADPQAVYLGVREWKAIRAQMKGVDIRILAALTGINRRTLRAYRQGTRRPPPESVRVIAEALARMVDGR